MGIVTRVRAAIGRDGDERSAVYRCVTCQSTFDGPAAEDRLVFCPNCGSDAVKPV
ncbi:zinc ribbon domain-containing protein [Halobium salinum]|uniref:Zinc ribbon domain-containing protein n=1 Tax=Halobium salinum TaxID=1364940 RepID=A0ABD5PD63_9EURY|nr:zinc ribbon domain-containing protein [Halobium salinum]